MQAKQKKFVRARATARTNTDGAPQVRVQRGLSTAHPLISAAPTSTRAHLAQAHLRMQERGSAVQGSVSRQVEGREQSPTVPDAPNDT